MKNLTECEALLFAFVISSVSLFATLTSAVVFGKQPRRGESETVNADASHGRQIFAKHCAECHGFDARGEEGPNLRNIRAGDKLVRQVIVGGIKGEMPAYGKFLSEPEIQALTAYLRALRNQ